MPVLLLDGLDELDEQIQIDTVIEIYRLIQDHPAIGIVISCRTVDWQQISTKIPRRLPLEEWHMPPLSWHRTLSELHQVGPIALDARALDLLRRACQSPLVLDLTLDLLRRGITMPELDNIESYRRYVTATYAERVLADQPRPHELNAFCQWIARTLRSMHATTLDLAALTSRVVPRENETFSRVLQLVLMSVPLAIILITTGAAVGLGWMSGLLTLGYLLLVYGIGATPVGRWLGRRRKPPRIVARRRFQYRMVPTRLSAMRRRDVVLRALLSIGGGAVVGVLLGLSSRTDVSGTDYAPLLQWLTVASIPVAAVALGGLGAGLVGGLLGAVAFGLSDDFSACIVGGVCAGTSAFIVFLIRDMGDRTFGFTRAQIENSTIYDRLRQSWVTSARAEMTSWIAMGTVYGLAAVSFTRNRQWLWHGLIAGLAGGLFFVMIAVFAPWTMLRAVEVGLRKSAVLGSAGLEGATSTLTSADLLRPSANGSAVRFRHPLLQTVFDSSTDDSLI
jgi:hypothetical protein